LRLFFPPSAFFFSIEAMMVKRIILGLEVIIFEIIKMIIRIKFGEHRPLSFGRRGELEIFLMVLQIKSGKKEETKNLMRFP